MNETTIAVALVIAFLVGAGAGYLFGNGSARTVTSVSTTSSQVTTTSTLITTVTFQTIIHETTTLSTATTPSLELIARVTPSTITSGQNVSITFGAYNPLSTNFTTSVMPYRNQYLAPCPISEMPTTYYVYVGHLSFSNLTQYSPLLLYDASIVPLCFVSYNSTLVFQPNSDRAAVHSFLGTNTFRINFTNYYNGYWMRGPGNGYSHTNFTPGEYTVLLNDTWGQRELHYFTVNP